MMKLVLLWLVSTFTLPSCLVVEGFSAGKEVRAVVGAAQILLDPRRKKAFKQSLVNSYPIVPASMVDVCIESTAKAFKHLTPAELQDAVQPGGFDKQRPAFCKTVALTLVQQKPIQDLPLLSKDDKITLTEALVNGIIDKILESTGDLLMAPGIRLAELEKDIRLVKSEMGRWRLLQYRIRQRPLWFAVPVALAICGGTLYSDTAGDLPRLFSIISSFFVAVSSVGKDLWKNNLPKDFPAVQKSVGFGSRHSRSIYLPISFYMQPERLKKVGLPFDTYPIIIIYTSVFATLDCWFCLVRTLFPLDCTIYNDATNIYSNGIQYHYSLGTVAVDTTHE
eukprot:scaffold40806_cov53-Attheya_sp.AAC.2